MKEAMATEDMGFEVDSELGGQRLSGAGNRLAGGQLLGEELSQPKDSAIPLQMTKALPKEEVFFRYRDTEAEEVERCPF